MNTSASFASIISLVTQKGGNGKSTLSLNLGYELGQLGYRVLLVDTDPQASLSKNILGEEALAGLGGIEDLYLNPGQEAAAFIQATGMEHVSLLPSHSSLAGVPAQLLYDGDGFFTLKRIVKNIFGFDYVLVDTPGSLEFLTLSALIASDFLLVPVYPALYSLLAVNDLSRVIDRMKRNFNAGVEILGVVLMMLDRRANLYRELEEEVRDFFGPRVFGTTISRSVRSEEATLQSVGVSGLYPECKLAFEYGALTHEVLERLGVCKAQPDRSSLHGG